MKITPLDAAAAAEKSVLEKFSEKNFNIEVNGFELLALRYISQRVGGAGSIRTIFSNGDSCILDNINDILCQEPKSQLIREEFESKIDIKNKSAKENQYVFVFDSHK